MAKFWTANRIATIDFLLYLSDFKLVDSSFKLHCIDQFSEIKYCQEIKVMSSLPFFISLIGKNIR